MRVIYLHQNFRTPQMSGGTYPYEMARRLVRRGHEVHVVTAERETLSGGWVQTEEAGIHVHWYPVAYSNHMGFKRRICAFAKFAWLASWKAASLPGDVIWACSPPLTTAIPAVYASRKKSIPMVFEVADLWPETAIAMGALKRRPAIAAARRLERFAYQNAAHIVAMSPQMKAGIASTGYPREKITVIPNGCDPQLFRVPEQLGRDFRNRHDWLGNRPLVAYTGTLGLVNGVDYLARLAAVVRKRDPEIRFLTVGTGGAEETVRREAARLGVLDRNFLMHPPIPKSQMPAVLSAADVATSTVIDREALWANSANKVFDAMAASRPIVINHEGWFADLIRQWDCGLVLPPNELELAADTLVGALRDPQWLVRAGAAAWRVGEKLFARESLVDALESIFTSLVPTRRRGLAA